MNLQIRPEALKDYNSIAEVILLAFREDGEHYERNVYLADSLRHRYGFTPELALVAEVDEKVVGYALFSPCELYMSDCPVPAVFLSPLAVHPDFQKMGVGGRLLAEGHRRAREMGYGLSILYGDPEYYGRFGYRNKMFSGKGLVIQKRDLPSVTHEVIERPVGAEDLDWLVSLWREWHMGDPISLFPGERLMDWISHDPQYKCSVAVVDGKSAGYLQYATSNPSRLISFLADGPESAAQMLAHVGTRLTKDCLDIAAYPDAPVVKERVKCHYSSDMNMSIYAMLRILDEANPQVSGYFTEALSGESRVRVLTLPPALDL